MQVERAPNDPRSGAPPGPAPTFTPEPASKASNRIDAERYTSQVEDRAQLRSTLVASQLPIDAWHGAMADPTLAEAILDRLLHQGHRITVKGPSMRARDPDGAAAPAPSSATGGSPRGGIS